MLARFSRIAFMSLAGLACAVLAMELLFQIVMATPLWRVLPLPEVSLYAPDPDVGYGHRPGAAGVWISENRTRVTISSLGLRDRERSPDGPGPRAVVIGNSQIEALQVDQSETATAVAEAMLRMRHEDAEVINLGLSGATQAVEMARLRSIGMALKPDVALVVMPMEDFLSPLTRDDSAFVGYRPAADGAVRLSHGFRDGRGYRFRTSSAGALMYAALDRSAVATLLNNRKNIGLFAEWRAAAAPAAGRSASGPGYSCDPAVLAPHLALWTGNDPSEATGVRNAFLRDIAALQNTTPARIVAVSRGIEARCPEHSEERARLMAAVAARFRAAGVGFADLDAMLVAAVGAKGVHGLHGFGPMLGRGHLNVHGNRVYGAIFADLVEQALAERPAQAP